MLRTKPISDDILIRIDKKHLFSEWSSPIVITRETRIENASRVFTGGVRINNSMYRTDKETEEYINKSLERKLP